MNPVWAKQILKCKYGMCHDIIVKMWHRQHVTWFTNMMISRRRFSSRNSKVVHYSLGTSKLNKNEERGSVTRSVFSDQQWRFRSWYFLSSIQSLFFSLVLHVLFNTIYILQLACLLLHSYISTLVTKQRKP